MELCLHFPSCFKGAHRDTRALTRYLTFPRVIEVLRPRLDLVNWHRVQVRCTTDVLGKSAASIFKVEVRTAW